MTVRCRLSFTYGFPKNRVLASHSIQGGGASNAFMSGLVYLEASASKSRTAGSLVDMRDPSMVQEYTRVGLGKGLLNEQSLFMGHGGQSPFPFQISPSKLSPSKP